MAADPLDALLENARNAAGLPAPVGGTAYRPEYESKEWPSGAKMGVRRCSYTHDAMVDLIVANPIISQNELAAHFGYTPSWVSQVIASDAFQARLAERTQELVDPAIRATVEEKFKGIVTRSLAILAEKLDRPTHQIPDNLVLRSLELGSRALGYGARDTQPASQVNMHLHLESLGENLTQLLHRKKAALPDIEGELDSGDPP